MNKLQNILAYVKRLLTKQSPINQEVICEHTNTDFTIAEEVLKKDLPEDVQDSIDNLIESYRKQLGKQIEDKMYRVLDPEYSPSNTKSDEVTN